MGLYIVDDKKGIITHYCTNRKTERAIIALIEQIEDIVSSESYPGYQIRYEEIEENRRTKA